MVNIAGEVERRQQYRHGFPQAGPGGLTRLTTRLSRFVIDNSMSGYIADFSACTARAKRRSQPLQTVAQAMEVPAHLMHQHVRKNDSALERDQNPCCTGRCHWLCELAADRDTVKPRLQGPRLIMAHSCTQSQAAPA